MKKHKILKLFIVLFVLVAVFALIVFATVCIEGYEMYQSALQEKSMDDTVNEIRSASGYVTIDKIPKDFKNAIIAIEDHRYESHGPVDFISIIRAIVRNISEFRIVEGGSTITQQFAKNTFFSQEQKFSRKMAEVFAAIDLEKKYSKGDIIEMYINTIYYGDGFYGIGAASKGYFNKEPMELNLYEITLLAGIPNAPGVYSLSENPDLAKQRQKQVINAMVKYGYLTQEQANSVFEESSGQISLRENLSFILQDL